MLAYITLDFFHPKIKGHFVILAHFSDIEDLNTGDLNNCNILITDKSVIQIPWYALLVFHTKLEGLNMFSSYPKESLTTLEWLLTCPTF